MGLTIQDKIQIVSSPNYEIDMLRKFNDSYNERRHKVQEKPSPFHMEAQKLDGSNFSSEALNKLNGYKNNDGAITYFLAKKFTLATNESKTERKDPVGSLYMFAAKNHEELGAI